jgi:hypothetical protein
MDSVELRTTGGRAITRSSVWPRLERRVERADRRVQLAIRTDVPRTAVVAREWKGCTG